MFCCAASLTVHAGCHVMIGSKTNRVNWGRARKVPKPNVAKGEKILVHRSVKIKMEAEGLEDGKYEPKSKFDLEECEWVD